MKKIFWFVFIILCIILLMLFLVKKEKISEDNKTEEVASEKISNSLKVTYLDIGQGDASFVTFPNGEQMLIDCSMDGRVLEALERLMPYYDKDLDYLMITHPDLDHYGGCEEVLERFSIKNIIYNGLEKTSDKMWLSFWQAVQNEGANYIEIDKEEIVDIASSTLHFFYPDHSLKENKNIPNTKSQANGNNTSIVFKLSYLDKSLLFMADAEEELENYLLKVYDKQLDSDILKLGHHGSDSSSIEEFLQVVTPEQAIASCGLDNKFGHPSRRVLKRLERVVASSTIWRTDLQGDIFLNLDETGLQMFAN